MAQLHLKFAGIDGENRPVFKTISKTGKTEFIGSADDLFDMDAFEKDVIDYFETQHPEKKHNLQYFGHHFGCEPEGGDLGKDIQIVFDRKRQKTEELGKQM